MAQVWLTQLTIKSLEELALVVFLEILGSRVVQIEIQE